MFLEKKEDFTNINLKSIEKNVYSIFFIILLLSIISRSLPVILGVITGGGIIILNFLVIKGLVEYALIKKWKKKKFIILIYPLKYLIIIGIIFFVIHSKYFDKNAFILGLSVLFLGIFLEVVKNIKKMFWS